MLRFHLSTENKLTRDWRILSEATRDARLTRGALAILAHILETSDESGAELRQQELATLAGLSRPNVSRALRRLEELGYLRAIERGDRVRPSVYTANVPGPAGQGITADVDAESDLQGAVQTHGDIVEITGADFVDGVVVMTWAWRTGEMKDQSEEVRMDLNDPDHKRHFEALVRAAEIGAVDDSDQLKGAMFRVAGDVFQPL